MITVILLVIIILIIMSLIFLVDTKCSKKCDNVEHLDADENMCNDIIFTDNCTMGGAATGGQGGYDCPDPTVVINNTLKCSTDNKIKCKLNTADYSSNSYICTNVPIDYNLDTSFKPTAHWAW